MKSFSYWVAISITPGKNIRGLKNKDVLEQIIDRSLFLDIKKVTINYENTFDLVLQASNLNWLENDYTGD